MTPPVPAPSVLRTVPTIVLTALRLVVRDRLGLFFIVVLPFVIILLFGVGGAGVATASIGLAADEGPEATALAEALEADAALSVERYAEASALRRAVRRGELVGGLVADDLERDLAAGRSAEVRWLADPGSTRAVATEVAVRAVLGDLDARLTAIAVAVEELDLDRSEAVAAADETPADRLLGVEEETIGEAGLRWGVDEAAQQNAVLFIFITGLTGGVALIESRRQGTARRMLAGPVSSATILLGEGAARFALCALQAALIVAGAALLFGVGWGTPAVVAAVVGLFSLVATGASMLFGASLSNPEQAWAIAPPAGIALGMLGGALWPLEMVGSVMQAIGRLTPHAWAIDGLRAARAGQGLGDVADALAVLAAWAVALLVVAVWRLRRSLTA